MHNAIATSKELILYMVWKDQLYPFKVVLLFFVSKKTRLIVVL